MTMQPTALKIISLNIEQDRHLDCIIPFLQQQKPDVVLLQEVLHKDITKLENALEMKSVFTQLSFLQCEKDVQKYGMATFSSLPIVNTHHAYYKGSGDALFLMLLEEAEKMARAILMTEVVKDNQSYCLINTHFTWSPDGNPTALQHENLNVFFQLLEQIPEFILCGDFNAPRGTAIFEKIASKYKDNIPLDIQTTIDKNLHRAGDLGLVVDGLFTTPRYSVESIKLFDSLSDHWAIVASVRTS